MSYYSKSNIDKQQYITSNSNYGKFSQNKNDKNNDSNMKTNQTSPTIQIKSQSQLQPISNILVPVNPSLSSNNTINNYKDSLIYTHKYGINNIGNSCFMSSALQSLLHIRIFIEEIRKIGKNRKFNLMNKIIDLIEEIERMESKRNESRLYIDINKVYDYFISKGHFEKYTQQDAQEFLRILIDSLSSEVLSNDQCQDKSIISNIFYGELRITFTCNKCKYKSYKKEEIFDFPLTFTSKRLSINAFYIPQLEISIELLLDIYFKNEIVNWTSICENMSCKEKVYHTKNIEISKLPQVIIISLQRRSFNFNETTKDMSKVYINTEISIGKYCSKDLVSSSITKYYLSSIINHTGERIDFGHYYTDVRIGQSWVQFDDLNVKLNLSNSPIKTRKGNELVGKKDFYSSNAYIVIYTLVNG